MKRIILVLFIITLLPAYNNVYSQNVLDGIYVKEHYPTRKVISYPHLREADVMWSKRIWRKLDLREKINHPLYFPVNRIKDRRSLSQVVIEAVQEGSLTAYDPTSDEFTLTLTKTEIDNKLLKVDTVWIENPEPPYDLEMKIVSDEFDPSSVKEYRMKEDWFFDRQRSVLKVRIIGILPIYDNIDKETGIVRGTTPLFWIYFPEARNIFANAEVFNVRNDAERRTLEDVFWKRMFGSYVYKEQNVYDRMIAEYKEPYAALLEAENVKTDIFKLEHDLWEY